MIRFFLAILILLLPYASGAEETRLRTITVQGQAEQEFAPDMAKFSVNILGKSANRVDAKKAHDTMLKSLMDVAKKYKIDDKDLSTGFSSINPDYDYSSGKRKFLGYSAQTQVNITLHDLKQVGDLQDSLVAAGFDNFQGPNYTLDKMFTYNDKVLANAVENAKQKAANIAEKMGEKLDKPIDIKEENVGGFAPQPMYQAKAMMLSATAESAVAQPAGIINIRSGVVATFSLK